jgi:ankyrin repeat protein
VSLSRAEQNALNESFLDAVRDNNLTRVKECLAAGADVNVTDPRGRTALFISLLWQPTKLALFLLDNGINKDHQDYNGQTALHEACNNMREDAVVLLITAGADLNLKNDNGYTPLHHAAFPMLFGSITAEKHMRILQALVEAGADVNAKGNDGRTAAACTESEEAKKYLKDFMEEKNFGAFRHGIVQPIIAPKVLRFTP